MAVPSDGSSIRRNVRLAWRRTREFCLEHISIAIVALLLGAGLIAAAMIAAPTRIDPATGEEHIEGWGDWAVTGGAILAILGIVLLVLGYEYRHGEPRSQRIQRLTKALEESMRTIASITAEMEEGERRLKELEAKAGVQRELANLTEPEAEAVRATLRQALTRERWPAIWISLASATLGFLLGKFFPP